jgi:hypothetical protein
VLGWPEGERGRKEGVVCCGKHVEALVSPGEECSCEKEGYMIE